MIQEMNNTESSMKVDVGDKELKNFMTYPLAQ